MLICGALIGKGTWERQADLLWINVTPSNESEYPTSSLFLISTELYHNLPTTLSSISIKPFSNERCV